MNRPQATTRSMRSVRSSDENAANCACAVMRSPLVDHSVCDALRARSAATEICRSPPASWKRAHAISSASCLSPAAFGDDIEPSRKHAAPISTVVFMLNSVAPIGIHALRDGRSVGELTSPRASGRSASRPWRASSGRLHAHRGTRTQHPATLRGQVSCATPPDASRSSLCAGVPTEGPAAERTATGSSGGCHESEGVRNQGFAVGSAVSQDLQGKRLHTLHGIFLRGPIDHRAGDLQDLGYPSAVFLAVDLDRERQGQGHPQTMCLQGVTVNAAGRRPAQEGAHG